MSIKITDNSANPNGLGVNTDHEMKVSLSQDSDKAGYAIGNSEVNGSDGVGRITRPDDSSIDYRKRVGVDSLLFDDTFNHAVLNTSKYIGVTSTATIVLGSGRMAFNAGSSLASGAVARVQTFKTFPLYLSYALYVDMEALFIQPPTQNNVCEFGLGYATTTTTPTDGIFFRLNASGALQGVVNYNGSETTVTLDYTHQVNVTDHYLIVAHNDITEFWINDVCYGTIETPAANGSPCMSMNLPLLFREYNSGVTSIAQQMQIQKVSVSLADMQNSRLWATQMSGMGQSSINTPDGATAGFTANYANSAAPASATLSNTAAGYTTLGGQFQFAAVAGSETDFALFGYQVPVGSAASPAKSLCIRGIRIETFNMGAASATTPTLLQWGLGIGSTAVSLATADSATAGTRAPRRLSLGIQSIPVASAIGYACVPVDINLDAPVIVEAGTFCHIILKVPVGTATASQIIRGTVSVNGFFE